MTGKKSKAGWRGDCLWVGGFVSNFLVTRGQQKRGAMSTGENIPKEWGGESIGRKKPELTLQSSRLYTGAALGLGFRSGSSKA